MEIIDIHMSVKGALDDAIARAVAIAGLTAIAFIHVLQLPAAFEAIGYLGGLFVAAIVACLLIAAVMTRVSHALVWAAAGGLAGLILLCYVLSRSVGLPGFTGDVGEWSEPLGLASMVAEGLLVVVAAAILVTRRQVTGSAVVATTDAPAGTTRGMRPGPAVG